MSSERECDKPRFVLTRVINSETLFPPGGRLIGEGKVIEG